MKYKKKFFALLLALILSAGILAGCTPQNPSVKTNTTTGAEGTDSISNTSTFEKQYCEISIDDSFGSDTVSIRLMPQFNEKPYTVDDFPELDLISIREVVFENIPETEPRRKLILTLKESSKENVISAIRKLEKRDDVYFANPDWYEVVQATPNDASYATQWALEKISLPSAWNISTGSTSIVVGVIDTGIDASHPDLQSRVNTSLSRSFHSAYSSGTEDVDGHGTHVAGIIGAQGNNGIGITGTCWNITLVSLRVANGQYDSRTGKPLLSIDAVEDAIIYAEQQGIDILNYSAGGVEYHQNIYDAISNYSGLFICAAGNEANNNDTKHHYPSDYNLPNIISVGASSKSNAVCGFSNYGSSYVDIFAPGIQITSCYPLSLDPDGYNTLQGTSMATPFVTGVAALILSAKPTASATTVKSYILNNTDYCSSLDGYCVTDGRLNAYKALSAATHVHSYTYRYTSVSSTGHNACCSCGAYISQAHTFTSSGSTLVCSKCGYSSISLNNQGLEVEMQ